MVKGEIKGECHEIINKGQLLCNKKILLSIISLAALEISGVSSLVARKRNFFSFFSSKKNPGVEIKFTKNGNLIVNISLIIVNGYNVPDVAFRVQENVKTNISAMVDVKVTKVNVHVVGVEFLEEKNIKLIEDKKVKLENKKANKAIKIQENKVIIKEEKE